MKASATKSDQVSFDVTRDESKIIMAIAQRAVAAAHKAGVNYTVLDADMDVTACHANGNRLRLQALLDADDFNFAHDIFGIRNCLNRETGKLERHFSPRFSA